MSQDVRLRKRKTVAQRLAAAGSLFAEPVGEVFVKDGIVLHHADVLTLYPTWEVPTVIVSDGAYGLGSFAGDPYTPDSLAEWYEPHVRAWSERATPQTTLWFWNGELGWANVHPLLVRHGWRYVNCHVWDKGISHVAGNSNTQTLRKFPVVTEVCVQYVKEAQINGLSLREWLRREWERTGLPLALANEACEVKNAATRKYLTKDHLWYFPPPDVFGRLAAFANRHGKPQGAPYFSLDGQAPLTPEEWSRLRAKFYCKPGITNVWHEPPLNGDERIKAGPQSVHLNQKPVRLLQIILEASSDEGEVIWEPFGGLCSAAVAAYKLRRRCLSAEINREFFELAVRRLQ
jgi:site-specific DNA-methyltransferase (adenine-specific)